MDWHAWAAGFIDGEGCITFGHQKKSGQTYLVVSASQSFQQPLLKLKELFGGTIEEVNRKAVHRHFLWRVCSERAITVLKLVRPYLLVKNDQADLGMEYWMKCSHPQGYNKPLTVAERENRAEFVGKMRILNHRQEKKVS